VGTRTRNEAISCDDDLIADLDDSQGVASRLINQTQVITASLQAMK
jgi:hypothetical protein